MVETGQLNVADWETVVAVAEAVVAAASSRT